MNKAVQIECETMRNSVPVVLSEEEQGWSDCNSSELTENRNIGYLWHSNVPGSHATEHVIIAAIQDTEHMGYDVTGAEKYIDAGVAASERGDYAEMGRLAGRIFHELNVAPKIPEHPYWSYKQYESFEAYKTAVKLPVFSFDLNSDEYEKMTHLGWVAQICGGALGTALEGYTKENLKKAFGDIYDYVRKPNTYNDDITYELALLEAFKKAGHDITSADIAEQWLALIPTGWSAEDRALRNLQLGVFPPMSGAANNPYREWIGAQMRGAVCGMIYPGNIEKTARLAFMDGQVSHYNNGVLGEVFNAVLTSAAYVKKDMREILSVAFEAIPADSEYYSVIDFALKACQNASDWEEAWQTCENKYGVYNWIHAYPNAAAEIVALYFGGTDFNEVMHIIASVGFDVDCNAAQIATAVAIASGKELDSRWTEPIGDLLITYMRNIKEISIKDLAHQTVLAGRM